MADSDAKKEENILLEWSSSSWPFKKRTREFYRTVGALIFLLSVILFFFQEFLLIGLILATFFAFYVLSSVPPEQMKHKITTLGVETANIFHRWEVLHEFWFDERYGEKIVVIRTLLPFPTHLQMLLGDISPDKIQKALADHLPYKEKIEKTWLDNAAAWLSKNIPLEKASS